MDADFLYMLKTFVEADFGHMSFFWKFSDWSDASQNLTGSRLHYAAVSAAVFHTTFTILA